ncbi:MAG: glutamate racemase [Clostridia bacterium]|nr:glutamate racemase [Clostridia bacterium]MBR0026362.1 glutamate racemase [Clostridia bacterium]
MKDKPIGVFDSGLGGASVLREALKELPKENFIYFGDNSNAPYGDRSEEEINRLTANAADWLMQHGVKALLLACNTATGVAIRATRERLSVPVVSVEPAIKPACALPGDGKVFMCATYATTRLSRYRSLQARMPDPSRVINVPCPGLADRIEKGIFDPDAFNDLFDRYFAPYQGMEAAAIVLGCTHYVFIRDAFARYAARHLAGTPVIMDGNAATACQLRRVLAENGLLKEEGEGSVEFHTSGDRETFEPIFRMLIGR